MPSWLETLRQKHLRVQALRAELAALEAELRDAKAILAGKGDIVEAADPTKPKSRHGFVGGKRAKPIQHKSSVWWTQEVLREAGQPLHIDRILERIFNQSGERIQRNTLVSNLSRYVKHHDTFTRPEPSVYGLVSFTGVPANGEDEVT